MSWPTTRRYPRSMAEAWQQDGAEAITHYRRPPMTGLDCLLGIVVGVVVAFLIAYAI
jgi:hypothetical protein